MKIPMRSKRQPKCSMPMRQPAGAARRKLAEFGRMLHHATWAPPPQRTSPLRVRCQQHLEGECGNRRHQRDSADRLMPCGRPRACLDGRERAPPPRRRCGPIKPGAQPGHGAAALCHSPSMDAHRPHVVHQAAVSGQHWERTASFQAVGRERRLDRRAPAVQGRRARATGDADRRCAPRARLPAPASRQCAVSAHQQRLAVQPWANAQAAYGGAARSPALRWPAQRQTFAPAVEPPRRRPHHREGEVRAVQAARFPPGCACASAAKCFLSARSHPPQGRLQRRFKSWRVRPTPDHQRPAGVRVGIRERGLEPAQERAVSTRSVRRAVWCRRASRRAASPASAGPALTSCSSPPRPWRTLSARFAGEHEATLADRLRLRHDLRRAGAGMRRSSRVPSRPQATPPTTNHSNRSSIESHSDS